jgi:hypothetical protein
MRQSEIRDLQDNIKRWNRFRVTCKHRVNLMCKHANLGEHMHCNVHLCPGGEDEPRGIKYTTGDGAPFIG